jgi:heme/copper-type cytochrome/quinol oxidase subunit 2
VNSILAIIVTVIVIALPLYCVVDAANRSSDSFSTIHNNKALWIVLTLVFPFLGPVTYLATIRPKFVRAPR